MDTPAIKIPVIDVGKYAGAPIDALPNSYLRWMLTQDFPKEWLECARTKLEASDYSDIYLSISRHAIDMFSKRFLWMWLKSENKKGDDAMGLGTFIATLAQEAWDCGRDTSKHRHKGDGVVRSYKGIQWVFGFNPHYPDLHDVITVMTDTER